MLGDGYKGLQAADIPFCVMVSSGRKCQLLKEVKDVSVQKN